MNDWRVIDEALEEAASGRRVRRDLPAGGRLYLDRQLPFLCVFRRPNDPTGALGEQLVSTEAAYLIVGTDKASRQLSAELLRRLASLQTEHFAGFLILEIWLSSAEEYRPLLHAESGETLSPAPWFRVHVDPSCASPETEETLIRSLRRIRVLRQAAAVESTTGIDCHPAGGKRLLSAREVRRVGCHLMGLEVRPVFRDPENGEAFPRVLQLMRRRLSRALHQAFFTFAQNCTNIRPRHYHTLGRRSFVKVLWESDRQLAAIEDSFDLLLQATPNNAEAAWLEFRRSRFEKAPSFRYRPLAVEPARLKRRLYEVPLARIEDATLAYLLRQKQDELDRKITMLADVATPRFLFGSLQVHGAVDEDLLGTAREILQSTPPRSREGRQERPLDAHRFAQAAIAEIERYGGVDPTFRPEVEVRDDIYAGLLVSQGKLLIGRKTLVPAPRAEALIQHEVGTHLVTYHNGRSQPFRQLAVGLAGYDGLQEGLAVLSEYFAGGLDRLRLRVLAARVLAVHSVLDGAGFVDTFRLLDHDYGFSQRLAYTVAMRIHRAGGLTKDAGYLKGLLEILRYFAGGGDLEPLLVGKIAADHIPLVEELRLRKVLHAPALRPHYLQCPEFEQRMNRVRQGATVLQLIEGTKR